MNLETIKKRIFENIVIKGFDIHKNGYSFVKQTPKIRCEVGFSIEEEYSVTENEVIDFVKAFCFWASIAYPEMENILHPILAKNELFGKYISTDEISSSFFNKDEKKIFLGEIGEGIFIKNDTDIKNLISELQLFFSNEALPFFEKWHNLNVLYEYIKDKTEDELWEILGQFAPMKKAVILRLCNDSNYQSFMDNYFQKQKEYFEEDPEDIDNIRYYNVAKELKEILDKTEPIYNL
ncbi:hypothetical protein [Capnocytophaga canimorsus]|uniref:hypothetical protein n=1 Tax=Capnocytophaga canimorsus TaxID=28188 RepID=UPI00385C0335